jgi:hypothetical protein
LLLLLLLIAMPLELLPLCCAMAVVNVGRSRDRDATSAAGLVMGLVGTGLRLMVAPRGSAGISRTEGMLGLRGPVLGGDWRRPRIGDSVMSSSGSVTSATECRLV